MDNDEFEMLFETLKILEKEDLKDHNALVSIAVVISNFENELSDDQKLIVNKEFIRYDRISQRSQTARYRNVESF